MSSSSLHRPLVVLIMGVSGVGKSSVGEALAAALDAHFLDSDALHSLANVAKMQAGVPLDDADRAPWLAAVRHWIDATLASGRRGVIACSALRRSYRETVRCSRPSVALVHLDGDSETIRARLEARADHFMPPALLDSQISTLERPTSEEDAILVSAAWPIDKQVERILLQLRQGTGHRGHG